jgi:hypothetical protein
MKNDRYRSFIATVIATAGVICGRFAPWRRQRSEREAAWNVAIHEGKRGDSRGEMMVGGVGFDPTTSAL